MKKLYLKNEEEFTFELEAFLTKVKSVPDVLLEDFNIKFGLGINLETKLNSDAFERKALQLGNNEALAFIKWWKNKIHSIKSSYVGPLLDKRNLAIHRNTITPDFKSINLFPKISASVEVAVHDAKGNLVAKSSSIKPKDEKATPPKTEWSFKGYPNDNALDLSKQLLEEIHKMLEEAKNSSSHVPNRNS